MVFLISFQCFAEVDLDSVRVSRRIGLDFREGDTIRIDDETVDILEDGRILKRGQQNWEVGRQVRVLLPWGERKGNCSLGLTSRTIYEGIPTPTGDTWHYLGFQSYPWENVFEMAHVLPNAQVPIMKNKAFMHDSYWRSSSNPKVVIYINCFFSADIDPISIDEKEKLSLIQPWKIKK